MNHSQGGHRSSCLMNIPISVPAITMTLHVEVTKNPVWRDVCEDSPGAYVVNAKTAPADAVVDDQVTLW